ncbi:hypothetical protein HHL19_35745 [Streptomyces sp. R302]|uniref:hypothetical protein n=1 Tax=unclassified Streptomyces TaxID=2593676 RepID=UPI00145CF270|nr:MULTISPECIES: hypothetical protein [unclassified Streptomyces]NML55106.1 hypothetical protein [Streptomyces sp. R301]NML83864.1 hypothetical protein [Streptomyces sp. R302]
MALPATAPARPDCPALTLAERVAALLPARAGSGWIAEPYRPWWTARHPAARLVQGERALVLVANGHSWNTEVGWQLPGREPTRPDLVVRSTAPGRVAREALRLVLPVADDEAAARVTDAAAARHRLLYEIGAAMRAQGAATWERAGLLVNASTVAWGAGGVRYSATLHGAKPVCDVQITGPVRAVERACALFLPERAELTPARALDGIGGRLERRMAAFLGRYVDVQQEPGRGGLSFGTRPGVYGHAVPAADPGGRAHDTTPVSVELHGVGVDFLVSLAPRLTR